MEAEGTDPAIDSGKKADSGISTGTDLNWGFTCTRSGTTRGTRAENGCSITASTICARCRETESCKSSIARLPTSERWWVCLILRLFPSVRAIGCFSPRNPRRRSLAERGIKVDSSVFKGGLQHRHKLDYRPALRNGHYWRFSDSANVPDPQGSLLELPIYTQMVPAWRMLTAKRVGLQRKGSSAVQTGKNKLYRMMDLLRVRHPLKFDFCRMTLDELTRMMDLVIREDEKNPTSFRPIVAIGHTKDLVDFETVESFLSFLDEKGITVSTFKNVYEKCGTINR